MGKLHGVPNFHGTAFILVDSCMAMALANPRDCIILTLSPKSMEQTIFANLAPFVSVMCLINLSCTFTPLGPPPMEFRPHSTLFTLSIAQVCSA